MTDEMVPAWESKLWSYISNGNGEQCPLYDTCRVIQQGGQCFYGGREHFFRLIRFLDNDELNKDDYDLVGSDFATCIETRKIFRLVRKLARKYIKMGNVCSPPVSAELIGLFDRKHRVEVREVSMRAYHAAIWNFRDSWVIQLNKNDTPARKRFSLFHEAFHIVAHSKTNPVFRKAGIRQGSFNELLADHFAGSILMPPEWVNEKWAEIRDVDKMAETFQIPKPIVLLGLKGAGLL